MSNANALDENKTSLTHRVTAVAAAYLDALGCKPVETEVPVRTGWVADLATYWYPNMTQAKKLSLDRRAREILGISDRTDVDNLLPCAYGDGPFTVVVEVKTTISDFKRDGRKWNNKEWPAHICFIAFPTGIAAKDDLPRGWHGLETTEDGTRLCTIHEIFGPPHPQHSGLVLDLVAAVGIRRDHRTRYAAMKAFDKAWRAEDRECKARYSAARLLEGLAEWIQGQGWDADRSLLDVLPELGIKQPPSYCKEAIALFESLREDLRIREVPDGR